MISTSTDETIKYKTYSGERSTTKNNLKTKFFFLKSFDKDLDNEKCSIIQERKRKVENFDQKVG